MVKNCLFVFDVSMDMPHPNKTSFVTHRSSSQIPAIYIAGTMQYFSTIAI